ncbi:MAG: hypothetical protein KJ737_12795 [Proteobacteria bacterium]|nr:hypothetical protein [Pseudomonadota bacterium]
MNNVLLENAEFKIEVTSFGTWRRYLYPTGMYFSEFKSRKTILGFPLIHYTNGKNPETGRRIIAKGIIAVGRLATGVFAIGHASLGLIAVGQLGLGFLFGFGQATIGCVAIGQLAIGLIFGFGQIATGITAIGQVAFGKYVLAQIGFGDFMWTPKIKNPTAINYFRSFLS